MNTHVALAWVFLCVGQGTMAAVSPLQIKGHVEALLYEHGRVVFRSGGDNLVVDGGTLRLMNLLAGQSTGGVIQMICGSGTTWPTPQSSMTALDNQPGASVPFTLGVGTIVVSQPVSGQAVALFSANWTEAQNNFTINEVGLFAAGPLMVARFVFASPGIPKASNQSLVIQYSVSVTTS